MIIRFAPVQENCQWSNTTYTMVLQYKLLTHWGWVKHICGSSLTIIGSDNGLAPTRRQAIIWTNAGILWIGPLGTNLSEILTKITHFHSRKYIWKCCLQHFVSASMCWCPNYSQLTTACPLWQIMGCFFKSLNLMYIYTMWCQYNTAVFLHKILNKRHPTAWGVFCGFKLH